MTFRTSIIFYIAALIGSQAAAQTPTLSMQDAVTLALKHNRTLSIAGLDIAQAKEEKRIAKSLYLPTAGVGGQYLHYFDKPAFFGFGNATDSKIPYTRIGGRDQFTAFVSVSQPLYNPSARPSLESAYLRETATRADYRMKQNDLVASVKLTYLGILVLRERLKLQHESLQRNLKALADARSLLAQGRALRVDTLRAYTSVRNLEPDIQKLNYAIDIGKLQLVTLTGIDSLQSIELADSLVLQPAEAIPSEDEVYAAAKTQRPDLQKLSLEQQISEQQVALARALQLPSVSLIGQYQVQTQADKFNFFKAYWPPVSYAGVQVALPIFTGYSNVARIKQARIAGQQSATRVADAWQQLRTEVRQVIANLNETYMRLQTQEQVKNTAQLSYDIIQYRYSKGVTSRLELTDAELALTTAQLNYLESVYNYQSARIELDRTLGK